MGGFPSLPTTIDYVVSINGEAIDTITLPPVATLANARTEIQLDATDGIQRLPSNGHFQFILSNGTPVARRKEQDRSIQDALKKGCLVVCSTKRQDALNNGCLVLCSTKQEEKKSLEDNDEKVNFVHKAKTTDSNDPTCSSTASKIGTAASVVSDSIGTAATITDAIKGELTETKQTITNTESIEEKNIEDSAVRGINSTLRYRPNV